jgi:Amt family ammonium transporter
MVHALAAGPPFKTQVSGDLFTQDIFYILATVFLLFIVGAVGLIDAGLVRRKNLLDTWVQKLVCSLTAAAGMALIGFAIWEFQFYQAFGIPHPLKQAIEDWWPFGSQQTTFSQNLDPAVYPEADVFQIFLAFFMAYAAVGGLCFIRPASSASKRSRCTSSASSPVRWSFPSPST